MDALRPNIDIAQPLLVEAVRRVIYLFWSQGGQFDKASFLKEYSLVFQEKERDVFNALSVLEEEHLIDFVKTANK
jgi:hypothetical protein